MRPDPGAAPRVRQWLAEGTALLIRQVDKVPDERMTAPSALPGWSTGHLLTHLARNADALANLAHWAATGVETPMYPGGALQRLDDIEAGATRPAEQIRRDVADSAERLGTLLAALPEPALAATVRTGQGREVAGSLIPWLRTREVWIHLVDLVHQDTGFGFGDLPADLAAALLPDVVATLAARPDCPSLALYAEPGGPLLTTRPPRSPITAVRVSGTVPDLLCWLTGRGGGQDPTATGGTLPTLPAWL